MIKLICIGKLKEKYFKEAEEEYTKRIKKFIPFSIEEIEENAIKKYLEKCNYAILLNEKGNEMDSIKFSSFLNKLLIEKKNICFFIGGWRGLDMPADFVLSISKMTFPYQLCRIIFIEQIYRAVTMAKGINYHK